MYISSLRKYIVALDGELDIVARFPEGDVHIQNFMLDLGTKVITL
jgi:hypothetical protein